MEGLEDFFKNLSSGNLFTPQSLDWRKMITMSSDQEITSEYIFNMASKALLTAALYTNGSLNKTFTYTDLNASDIIRHLEKLKYSEVFSEMDYLNQSSTALVSKVFGSSNCVIYVEYDGLKLVGKSKIKISALKKEDIDEILKFKN